MIAAFAEAKAAQSEPPTTPEAPAAKAPDAPPAKASEQPPASTPEPNGRTFTQKAAIQSALDLIKQGRETEVAPDALGLVKRYAQDERAAAIAEYKAEQETESNAKTLYLQLEAERIADGDAFAQKIVRTPEVALFHNSYRQAHPEVTLETPNARKVRSEQDIANELTAHYGKGFEAAIDAIAPEVGISEAALTALKAEFAFGKHPDSNALAVFLAKMLTQVASVAGKEAKAKADGLETENKAYLAELQALRIAAKTTPASMSSALTPGGPRRSTATSTHGAWAEAYAEAAEQLGRPA